MAGRHLRRHLELAWALNICALAQARELGVEDVVKRGKHAGVRSPTEWRRLALEAAHRCWLRPGGASTCAPPSKS
jgi:hypothetical protein